MRSVRSGKSGLTGYSGALGGGFGKGPGTVLSGGLENGLTQAFIQSSPAAPIQH